MQRPDRQIKPFCTLIISQWARGRKRKGEKSVKVPKARKLPSGTWRIQVRLGGESINVNARTEKECVRLAQITKAEYLAGKRQPPPEPEPEAEKLPTLRKAIDGYIDSRVLSPATVRGYIKIRDLRFQPLMDLPLDELTQEVCQQAIKTEGWSSSAKTIRNAWSFVATVMRHYGIHPPRVSTPQVIPHDTPFLDADEIQIFRRAVKGNPYSIPIYLALHGLRRSEILALRWENVDLKRRRIRVAGAAVMDRNDKLVQKKENKNRASTRYVPILMDELYDALKAAQQPEGLVVTCNPNTIRSNIQRICAQNGLPPVGTHGLRHSFASLAYHLEVPEKITMEIGGWSDNQTMRKIYTHVAQSDVKRYEDKFAAFFSQSPGENAHKNAHEK